MKDVFAKLAALVLWADGRIEDDELSCAMDFMAKHGLEKGDLLKEINALLDGQDSDSLEEVDEALVLSGSLDVEADALELLTDLAAIALADKEVSIKELDVLHIIGTAIGADPEIVSAALLSVAIPDKVSFEVTEPTKE